MLPGCIIPQSSIFLSTLSLRRATELGELTAFDKSEFLSTLSLQRATPGLRQYQPGLHRISIHALLAESDHDTGRSHLSA